MSNIINNEVEKFILSKTYSASELQKNMEQYANENMVPIVTRDSLSLLRNLINIKKPYQILEFGTAIGYSSIMLCNELKGNCNILTIERNKKRYSKAIENIEKAGFSEKINVLNMDALECGTIINEHKYDMVFIDAAKGQYRLFFDLVYKNVKNGGIIISDNIFHKGMVCEEDISNVERRQRTIYRRMNDYLKFLTVPNSEFYTSLIPIGDGLAITYKR